MTFSFLTPLLFCFIALSSSSASLGVESFIGYPIIPISSLISKNLYDTIFLHKDDTACPAKNFYPYQSFIEASKYFPQFGTTGCLATRKREIAAFLAQISHETTGGWATAPDGPFSWGLCFKEEISPQSNYCDSTDKDWPCFEGKTYKGRGPIQLSWNYNYGPAGKALGFDGLRNPEIVSNNSVIAFKTALWFWMTERKPIPSCHNVMVGKYLATKADIAANRTAGFGLVTNIVNGGLECGIPNDARVNDRIGFFQRYTKLFNVDTGPNLDCGYQKSFQ
ncbi:putative chitinase [Medicago truncatula]|uniref:Chitinase n=1 Tax=Medicago truncatula TaxID=3880 RepID=G7KUN3_MEDTR|nr:chitinase 10 [Medicago truncatula]AES82295.1 Chitinase [Medicago truncatula]RHN49099.1 putative chitinase [Medicago truncatula]